jgi:hypothetical protein
VIGKRDGHISWGPSAVLNSAGEVVAHLPLKKTGLPVFDIAGRLQIRESSGAAIPF